MEHLLADTSEMTLDIREQNFFFFNMLPRGIRDHIYNKVLGG